VKTFADDTTIMTVGDSTEEATEKLQAGDKVNNWTKKWLIILNEAKSVHAKDVNIRGATKKFGEFDHKKSFLL
jgi:hypothetical protein